MENNGKSFDDVFAAIEDLKDDKWLLVDADREKDNFAKSLTETYTRNEMIDLIEERELKRPSFWDRIKIVFT